MSRDCSAGGPVLSGGLGVTLNMDTSRYEYLKGLTPVRLHSNEGGSCTQVCKTGQTDPADRSRKKDLPRTAAIQSVARAGKCPISDQ